MSGFTALEKKRLQQPARVGWEGAGPAPDFPPWGQILGGQKEKPFSGYPQHCGGSWKGIWVFLRALRCCRLRESHISASGWVQKCVKNLFLVAGLVSPVLAGASLPLARPWASRSAIATASAQLKTHSEPNFSCSQGWLCCSSLEVPGMSYDRTLVFSCLSLFCQKYRG